MKDSNKKSDKSSSDSISPVKNTIPEMPKDKRTKAYKEWIKKYGDQTLESNVIPDRTPIIIPIKLFVVILSN